MTRYRITRRAGSWQIDAFDPDTARWFTLSRDYDATSAELAGRAVDALVAMESLKEKVQA